MVLDQQAAALCLETKQCAAAPHAGLFSGHPAASQLILVLVLLCYFIQCLD